MARYEPGDIELDDFDNNDNDISDDLNWDHSFDSDGVLLQEGQGEAPFGGLPIAPGTELTSVENREATTNFYESVSKKGGILI